jgi:cellulose synthase operon protein C
MKKQRHAPAPRLASPDVLEKRGAEDLKHGRFKDAMEAFRQLVKIEPRPEWRQSLARAYVGRGRTLAAKGMYKEAPLLFDNAAGVDGAFHEPLIHLACLVPECWRTAPSCLPNWSKPNGAGPSSCWMRC